MHPSDVKNAVNLFEVMAELELVISEFYKTVGETWKENETFWFGLSRQEVSHAENIRRMADILKSAPQQFEFGRPFNITTVSTVTSGVRNLIKRVKNGEYKEKAILFLARDLEQSIVETKYTELLRTTETEYNKMIKAIVSQTEEHKQALIKKIGETK